MCGGICVCAGKLSEHCWLVGDGFRGPPPDDDAFWDEATNVVHAAARVAKPMLPPPAVSPASLAQGCQEELEVLDISEIRPGRLYLCNTESARSRLARAMLGIKGVVVLASAQSGAAMDLGTTQHFTIDTDAALGEQLPAAMRFVQQLSGPALICCVTGYGIGAAACAGALAANEGLSALTALEEVEKRRGPCLAVEPDDVEELASFCDAFLRMEFTLRLGPPPPPQSGGPSILTANAVMTPTVTGQRPPPEPVSPHKRAKKDGAINSPQAAKAAAAAAAVTLQNPRTWSLDSAEQ